jgi:5-methylcytosine-specific restriction enzyme subunit McrC
VPTKWLTPLTNWKNIDSKPSNEDVQQMFAYHHYFEAEKVALMYPGSHDYIGGNFIEIDGRIESTQECGLLFVDANSDVKKWTAQIQGKVEGWIENYNVT